MKPSEFLTILWGQHPPGLIQLWERAGKKSTNLRYPDNADHYAAGSIDVYCGVGLTHRDHGRSRRAKADEIIALAGLWLDLDVAAPGKRGACVRDRDEALAVARSGPTPTLLVSSGSGVHGWWLFEQPWRFASRDEQHAGALASAQWYALYRAAAAERGGGIDSTHDLSRLLRPPGTLNGKQTPPTLVEILDYEPAARYPVDGLLAYAASAGPVAVELPGAPRPTIASGGGTVSGTSVTDRLCALIENSQEFCDSWRNERADGADWSMSEYDLSVATQLALADWTDSDIAAAVTLHRLRHDREDPKAHRVDYIQRTVARARENSTRSDGVEQLRLLATEGRAAA